ncbi:MAG TPA: copper chaperone PCu(A)C [Caulobacteraceae bacterium]|nr:copper chaperone PCu(A)C [Caulobacteraceae bacterium]
MRSFAVFASFVVALAVGAAAHAAGIEARDAWIRATPPGAATAAGYVTLTNHGLSDRLVGGRTAVAGDVQVHEMSMTGGVMRMRPIPGGLAIGASQTVSLAPARDHLMLIGLKRPLKAGQHVKVVLRFQRAGDVAVDFTVRDAQPGGMGGMHM